MCFNTASTNKTGIYAQTREECEEKLAELIVQMKAEIVAEMEWWRKAKESV